MKIGIFLGVLLCASCSDLAELELRCIEAQDYALNCFKEGRHTSAACIKRANVLNCIPSNNQHSWKDDE